ncbi:hypothetical protein [Kitasatospora sp. NPDC018619]|uniref:hypothetical protein n=1 Tax=unclassified Kitasatospora TaxID=2633591 RepID=UPI0037B9D049
MGITDGSGLSLAELPLEEAGREHIRRMLRVLADLHASLAVQPPFHRVHALRALLTRLARCMALFSRRLTLTGTPAARRSALGATAA